MAEYEKALQLDSSSGAFRALLLFEMARLELKQSENPQAEGHMREAVRNAPQVLNFHALLAQALSRQGRNQEAEEEMRVEASIRQRSVQSQHASRD